MGGVADFAQIPIIDVSDLLAGRPSRSAVAERLGEACRESGFFYVVGHGVDEALQDRLRDLSREFFAQDVETKLKIRMALGGRAWRGYFRVGDELTSGKPFSLDATLKAVEQAYLDAAIELAQGNMSQAAKLLGISRGTLYGRLESSGRSGSRTNLPEGSR